MMRARLAHKVRKRANIMSGQVQTDVYHAHMRCDRYTRVRDRYTRVRDKYTRVCDRYTRVRDRCTRVRDTYTRVRDWYARTPYPAG